MTDYNMGPLPTITRPTVLIEYLDGGRTTFTVRHPGSNVEYVRTTSHTDNKTTLGNIKGFNKEFKRLATEIENGKRDPYHIMRTFVQHGYFKVRSVLDNVQNAF